MQKEDHVENDEKNSLAKEISSLTGISQDEIIRNNLNISTYYFWKELLRDEGYTVGRLDSRYKGIDSRDSGIYPEYNAELQHGITLLHQQ